MSKPIGIEEHYLSIDNLPAGGVTSGRGFTIAWHCGSLGSADSSEPDNPNGAYADDVILGIIHRIEFFEKSGFGCKKNREALLYLNLALEALQGPYRSTLDDGYLIRANEREIEITDDF